MRTNVKYLETKYTINPDKGKVHCLLKFGIELNKIPGIENFWKLDSFQNFIQDITNKYTGICSIEYQDNDYCYPMLVMKSQGLAKCSPNDNFNVSLGKKIASTRAQIESFQLTKFIYDNILKCIEKYYFKIFHLYNNCEQVIEDCRFHEKDLKNS